VNEVLEAPVVELVEARVNSVAVAGVITHMEPIPGADLIQLATADCGSAGTWRGVVGKAIRPGEQVTVFLQDALLPPNEAWAFMERHKWRVRMARFKGVPSECVIVPRCADWVAEPGTDLMDLLGVTKYEKPLPAALAGVAKGNFPAFIPKTDEPNFQRVRNLQEIMAGDWYATEKADGTSCTVFTSDGQMRVCSRNLELTEGYSLYWRMARHYGLERLQSDIALQFEIVGPGVQGNPMGLERNEIRVFTAHNIETGERWDFDFLLQFCQDYGLPMARLITMGSGPLDADALRKLAEIKYSNGRPGEGVVIRDLASTGSLKVINLLYKD